jgi:hypothetical protein
VAHLEEEEEEKKKNSPKKWETVKIYFFLNHNLFSSKPRTSLAMYFLLF